MRQKVVALVFFAALVLWGSEGWAHPSPAATVASSPVSSPTVAALGAGHHVQGHTALALVALLAAVACFGRMRRVGLAALTLWMVFQTGAHSAHHLGQPAEKAQCVVASVTAHATAIAADAPAIAALTVPDATSAPDPDPLAYRHAPRVPHEGRAPPILAL
jgi:hypothetical protein